MSPINRSRVNTSIPTRTQPSRSSKSKLPHPLQGLTLDKTYPQRKVEDWHNDAQNLLRPPTCRPEQNESTSTPCLDPHTAARISNNVLAGGAISSSSERKIHPPADPWNTYSLPQMHKDLPYLPQPQPPSVYPCPNLRRHQSSSSVVAPKYDNVGNQNLPQTRSYTFVPENPELFSRTKSRNTNHALAPIEAALMQRSHTTYPYIMGMRGRYNKTISEPNTPKRNKDNVIGFKSRTSLPTPVTVTSPNHLGVEAGDVNTEPLGKGPAYQSEVLYLPQVQISTPPLPRTTTIQQPASHIDTINGPSPRDVVSADDVTRTTPSHHSSSSDDQPQTPQRSFATEEPDLESCYSPNSDSEFEPASDSDSKQETGNDKNFPTENDQEDGGENEEMEIEYNLQNNRNRRNQTVSSVISSTTSLRARSSSPSSQDTEMIKQEPSSPTGSSPSHSDPFSKKLRTRNSRRTIDRTTKSNANNGESGQRRNGERRREQNAVAQKKFRWKKKQIAAQMEADLESATALASSLKKEVAEKDHLVNKLKGEVGNLKRKLKNMEE
ncbi:uncharacterized protein L201_004424 [Kwoniella dendrophila CBS 6074]|uniref:BZIP domain-containing protein n=1 Tax=Kwoniella dendrophila CBS 6074 TaxID=1295534 RepID=A0AAX4JVN8_9TREE